MNSQLPELPKHLAGLSASGIHPGQTVAQFEIGNYKNFVYLILDWDSHVAAIVDPQKDLTLLEKALSENGFTLKSVLLTHTHHDHIAGVPEIFERFPDVTFYVHPNDTRRLSPEFHKDPRFYKIEDGEILNVGSTDVEVLHTPGHSAGECSYFLRSPEGQPYLFTGDTVFIRDCGRTDFEDGSNEAMFASLQRIAALPSETVILPGHHYARECASTVARERIESAPFRCKSVTELAGLP